MHKGNYLLRLFIKQQETKLKVQSRKLNLSNSKMQLVSLYGSEKEMKEIKL